MATDEPPYLMLGTDVSAKYKGAFCEAKVKKVNRSVKCKVTFKNNLGTFMITDEQIKGHLRIGAEIEAMHPEKKQYFEAVINKMQDYSQYTVVFDDGDETTLRRTSLCLKSGRHFAESPTLDQFPLTNPEHFGSPVLGRSKGKRKRRSTMNSATLDYYSSDEELTPRKSRLSRGKEKEKEKDPDIGKVVCVDYGDRRKKDNWYPALITNTGQIALRINAKEEYLVRSFKDGKYYQVLKKDTREFNRDVSRRIENNSLKLAVEKAVLYTEKGVLPSQWAKALYVGMETTASNEEESHDTDTDSSDDEPTEEKDRFVAQLYKFMDERGTPINKTPTVGSKELNLYKLFKVVHKMHGYNRVTNQNKWKMVYGKMGFPISNPSGSNQIKSAYKRYLHSFEDFYRKLGCTMNSRSTRGMHRSDRNFITTRNKSRDVSSPKNQKDKEKSTESKPEQKTRHNSEKKDSKVKTESSPNKNEDKTKSPDKKKPEAKKADEKDEKTKVKKEENKPRLIRSQSLNKDKKDIDNVDEKKDTRHERARTREDAKREKTESPEKRKETRSSTKSEQEKKDKDDKKPESCGKDNSKKEEKLKCLKSEKSPDEKKELFSTIKKYEKFSKDKAEKSTIQEHISFKEKKEIKKEKVIELKKEKEIKIEKCDDSPTTKEKKERLRDAKTSRFGNFMKSTKIKEEKLEPETTRERKFSRDLNALKDDGFVTIMCDIKQEKDLDSDIEKDLHDHTSISGRSGNDDEDYSIGKLKNKRSILDGKDDIKSADDVSDDSDNDVAETSDGKDKNIEVGDRVKVKYGRGRTQKVYEAKVLKIEIESNEKRFYVHYAGWNTRYDEWVRKNSIVENISEHNRTARKQKKETKDTPSPKKNDRSRFPNIPSAPKLHRKNSTSSTNSSTISSSRTTRSDKSSLHSPQTSRALQLRKRACKKSFITALTDTSQDSESDEDSTLMDVDDDDDIIAISKKIKEEIISSNEEDNDIEPLIKLIKKEPEENEQEPVVIKRENEPQEMHKIEVKKYHCLEGKKLRVELENCAVRLDKPSHISLKHLRQEKAAKNIISDTKKGDSAKKSNESEVKSEFTENKELGKKTIEKNANIAEKVQKLHDVFVEDITKKGSSKEEIVLKETPKEKVISQEKVAKDVILNKEQGNFLQEKVFKEVEVKKQRNLIKDKLKESNISKPETLSNVQTKEKLNTETCQIDVGTSIILKEQHKDIIIKDQEQTINKEQERKDVGKLPEKKDVGKLQEKRDINKLQEKKDIGKLQEKKDIGKLQEKKDIGKLQEKKEIGKLQEKKEIGKLQEKKEVGKLQEKKEVGKLQEKKDVGKLQEKKDVGKLQEKKDVGKLQEKKDISKLQEKKDISKLQEKKDIDVQEKKNMSKMQEKKDLNKKEQDKKETNKKEQDKNIHDEQDTKEEQNTKDISKKEDEKKDSINKEERKDIPKRDQEKKGMLDNKDIEKEKNKPVSIVSSLLEKQDIPKKKELIDKTLPFKSELSIKNILPTKDAPEKDSTDTLIPVLKKADEVAAKPQFTISELIEKRYVEMNEKQPAANNADILQSKVQDEPKKIVDEKMPRLMTYMSSYKDTSFSSNLSSPASALSLFQSSLLPPSKENKNKDILSDLKIASASSISNTINEKTVSSVVASQSKPNITEPIKKRSYFPMFNFGPTNPDFTVSSVTSTLEKKPPSIKNLKIAPETPLTHQISPEIPLTHQISAKISPEIPLTHQIASKAISSDKPSIFLDKVSDKESFVEEKKSAFHTIKDNSLSANIGPSKLISTSEKTIDMSSKYETSDFPKQDSKTKGTDAKWKLNVPEDKPKLSLEHNLPAICKSKPIEVRPKSPHFDKFSNSFSRPEKLKPVAPVSIPLVEGMIKPETNTGKPVDMKVLSTPLQRKTPTIDFDALKNLNYPKKELSAPPVKVEEKESTSYASVIAFASSTVPNVLPPPFEIPKTVKEEPSFVNNPPPTQGKVPLLEKKEVTEEKKDIALTKEEKTEEKSTSDTIDFGESIHKGLTELSIGEKGKETIMEQQNSSSNSSHGSICNVFLNVSADKSGKDGKELFTPQKSARDVKEEKSLTPNKNFSSGENPQHLSSLSVENVEKLTSSLEKESSGFLTLYKKEIKKKKSKTSKKISDSFDKEEKLKDKLKCKKKGNKFDPDDPSRSKDELKSKAKKFKKNKNKKRFLKGDDRYDLLKTDESSSKNLFLEKIKKREKKKREEKKFLKTEEGIDFKTELSKKDKKKGKKNKDKLSGDRKMDSSEKKIKKKKKAHVEDNIDSDSDKESQIRLGEKKKKKDKKKIKLKDISSSDDAAESRLLIDEENATFTSVRSVPEKRDKPDDPDLSFLLCEEKVPASPVDVHSIPEDTTGSSSLDNSNNRSPSSDEERIRPVNLDVYATRSANVEILDAVNKRNAEASAVLDNTPPTTPSSSPASMPSSSPSHDREPFLHYTESTQSGRESCEREIDNFHCGLNRPDGIESEEYRAAATLAFAVCQSVNEKPENYRTPPLKRQKSELDEFSPSKRRKRRTEITKIGNTKYKAASRSPRGESCDTYDSSNASILTAGSPPHGSSLTHFSSFSHHSSCQTLNPAESTSCTKSSKNNFYIPLHEYKDPEKRISILTEKMTELKKIYASLKAEVAMIDRRRKKARKKIREAAVSAANNTSAHGDEGDNCS